MKDLQTRITEKGKEIYDPVRKRFVLLTPEEEVRQRTILILRDLLNYPVNRMAVERKLTYNGRDKRFDILVADEFGKPLILVECKAPGIALDAKVLDQIAVYNHVHKVPYLIVTNGIDTYALNVNPENGKYHLINDLPVCQSGNN